MLKDLDHLVFEEGRAEDRSRAHEGWPVGHTERNGRQVHATTGDCPPTKWRMGRKNTCRQGEGTRKRRGFNTVDVRHCQAMCFGREIVGERRDDDGMRKWKQWIWKGRSRAGPFLTTVRQNRSNSMCSSSGDSKCSVSRGRERCQRCNARKE